MADNAGWPEWTFSEASGAESMFQLARYANPAQLARIGLSKSAALEWGRGSSAEAQEAPQGARAIALAQQFLAWPVAFTLAPFNPRVGHGGVAQDIRSVPEINDGGAATCLDFAVAVAALCLRDELPVMLALAVPQDERKSCHAFAMVQEVAVDGTAGRGVYLAESFAEWHRYIREPSNGTTIVDLTPVTIGPGEEKDVLEHNRERTLELLESMPGRLHVIGVAEALRQLAATQRAGDPFFWPPVDQRDHGLAAWLPAPPPGELAIASHSRLVDEVLRVLKTKGPRRLLLHGGRGTGKSSLALRIALESSRSRGWFLDGSDRRTLQLSMAAAEAQCRGEPMGSADPENLTTLVSGARSRLLRTPQPWIVVVDNADGAPDEILDLIPTPRENQAVIVTTTNPAWLTATDAGRDGDGRRRTEAKWADFPTHRLTDEDLSAFGLPADLLAADARLPGLARMASANHITGAGLPASDVVRQTLAGSQASSRMTDAVRAASLMPPEHITVNWIAASLGLLGERETVRTGVAEAVEASLLEHGRRATDLRGDDDEPRWMHRLVQAEVRAWLEEYGDANRVAVDVLGSLRRHSRVIAGDVRPYSAPYTLTELKDLCGLLARRPADRSTRAYASAVTAVLDGLEPRGKAGVTKARDLAVLGIDETQRDADNGASTGDLVLDRALMHMAVARYTNQTAEHGDDEQVKEAIDTCLAAEEEVAGVVDGDDPELALAAQLEMGRAQAMRGIMMRKLGDSARGLGDHDAARRLLGATLEILQESYDMRYEALGEGPDPHHHVDRGQYNIGGACIVLANLLAQLRDDGVEAQLERGLDAYVGSLRRRRTDTMYRAASLWGVALALYTAAIHSTRPLALPSQLEEEVLQPLYRSQSDDWTDNIQIYLHVAEACVGQALRIRSDIDGPLGDDTVKARKLLLKIELAWHIAPMQRHGRRGCLTEALRPVAQDIGLRVDDLVVPETSP